MWIAHSDGWLSIVSHRYRPDYLLVRARAYDHIISMWPEAEVYELVEADYRYRADVLRCEVGMVLAERSEQIEYEDFKSSVMEPRLAKAFKKIWATMWNYGRTEDDSGCEFCGARARVD